MNYFPFHLGDYAAHTGHLEPMEDLAYRRLLDVYYMHEKALPSDVKKSARLARMTDFMDIVQSVLDEFFVLSDDGWHNKRADEELTAMHAKQEQQSTKDAHEAERMKRYRERRAEMFAALREAGIVPAWDVAMKELQRLFDANCNGPATDLQREQVANCNADATAIPIPIPTPIPTPVVDSESAQAQTSPPPAFCGDSNSGDINPKAKVLISPEWELPEAWGVDAENLGWPAKSILHEAEKFRQFYTVGKGGGTRRGLKGWRQSWSNWLSNAEKFAPIRRVA